MAFRNKIGTRLPIGSILAMIALMLTSPLSAQIAAGDSARALLSVKSSTPGYDVFLDEQLVGQTPLLDLPIVPGRHTVVIRRTATNSWMMTNWTREIELSAGDSLVLVAHLKRPYLIKSTPYGAGVYVDNTFRGETPLIVELPDTSAVKVSLLKEGYLPAEVVCAPQSGQFLHVTLEPDPAYARQQQELFEETRARKGRYTRRALLFTGLAVASGVAAIVFSNRADDLYQQYLHAGDPQAREQFFRDTERNDTYASLSLVAFQISLGLSLFNFIKANAEMP